MTTKQAPVGNRLTHKPSASSAKRDRSRLRHDEQMRREAKRRRERSFLMSGAAVLILIALGVGVRAFLGPPPGVPVSADSVAQVASRGFPSSDGGSVSLDGFRGSKVVLYFYEGQSCGACQTQLQQLQQQLPELKAEGARVIAATMDPVGVSTSVAQQLGLSFPILEDRDHVLGSAFGTYEASGHMGSVDQHSVVVIDANGNVAWRDLAGATMYVSADDILAAIKAA
jgi:thioredoxin-dependent peroxiredoxin